LVFLISQDFLLQRKLIILILPRKARERSVFCLMGPKKKQAARQGSLLRVLLVAV